MSQTHKLMIFSLIATAIGVSVGVVLKSYVPVTELGKHYIGFPGDMLLRMLSLISAPLIVSSVVNGVQGLGFQSSRTFGRQTGFYVVITTLLAVTLGLVLTQILKPGLAFSTETDVEEENSLSTIETMKDLVRNVALQSLVQAVCMQYKTERVTVQLEGSNRTEVHLAGHYVSGTNLLGLIIWSFVIGYFISATSPNSSTLSLFVSNFSGSLKRPLIWVMQYLPVGMMFLTISNVLEIDDWSFLFSLGMFVMVVALGLLCHVVFILPLVFLLATRRNPFLILKGVYPALVTALLTSSSSATMPITVKCCEERLRMDIRVTRFILPIVTTLNMNGTSIYEVVAVLFIAQLNRISLDMAQLISIGVIAGMCSLRAAGIPATGAMTTLFVLIANGLPTKDAPKLILVEFLLDRFNTVVNVLGDCFGVALVHELSEPDLPDYESDLQLARPQLQRPNTTTSEDGTEL